MSELDKLSRWEQEAIKVFVQRLYDRYGDRVHSAVLFGSKARGDAGPESDIDLLVTLSDDDPQLRSGVRRLAARVSLEYELLLSVRAVSRSQWAKLSRYRFPLYQSIVSEGIVIGPWPLCVSSRVALGWAVRPNKFTELRQQPQLDNRRQQRRYSSPSYDRMLSAPGPGRAGLFPL